MTAQRIFGVLFLVVGLWLLAMGVNPVRFAGQWLAGPFAYGTSDMATLFFLPGTILCVLGGFLMLFGPGGKEA